MHFGVERDNESLDRTGSGPFTPIGRSDEMIKSPGGENDHQDRIRPELRPRPFLKGDIHCFLLLPYPPWCLLSIECRQPRLRR